MQISVVAERTPTDIAMPLHAPDGFFSLPVAIAGYAVAAAVIGYAIHRTNRDLDERTVPTMGVMAAFIFAAQMLNFPVLGGTSGHMVGGALAAIVLGPWAAILVMTAVVGLQALLFQDGGLVVLGVNLLSMSILSVLTGYGVYWLVRRIGASFRGVAAGGFLGAWASVMASAVVVALLLAASGTVPLYLALPAMAGVHALIGLGEGLITVFALSFIRKARPQMLEAALPAAGRGDSRASARVGGLAWWVGGYFVALAAVLIAPLASASPDGLESVAERFGFLETAREAAFDIIPDYALPGVQNETIATILAGFVGVTVIYLLVAGGGYLAYAAIKRRT